MVSCRLCFQKLPQNTSNNGNMETKFTNEETYKLQGKQVKETIQHTCVIYKLTYIYIYIYI